MPPHPHTPQSHALYPSPSIGGGIGAPAPGAGASGRRHAILVTAATAIVLATALASFATASIAAAHPNARPIAQPGGPPGDGAPQVTIRVLPQKDAARPGDQLALAVVLDHDVGLHSWPIRRDLVVPPEFTAVLGETFIDSVIPTEFEVVTKPDSATFWPVQAPVTRTVDVYYTGSQVPLQVYAGRAIAFLPLQIDPGAAAGEAAFDVRVQYQACDETQCFAPVNETFRAVVRIDPAAAPPPADAAIFGAFDPTVFGTAPDGGSVVDVPRGPVNFSVFGRSFSIDPDGPLGLTFLLLVAALGGFLLNLTPCVLPVIPLKIMGMSRAAGQHHPRRMLLLGTTMSLGVIGFWLAIGGAIAFVSGFDAISSLFQTSWFSFVVGAFVAVMAIGMLGVFSVQLPQSVYRFNPGQETVHGSFLFGILTAVLSTPCTAPFMGSAAAWAATQRPSITLTTFAAIGLGMALPYFILTAKPGLVRKVPRTGAASDLVKQVMGLFMLAVAAFFLGIPLAGAFQRPPDPASRAYWWVVAFFVVAACVWTAWRTFKITTNTTRRAVFGGLGLLGAAAMLAITPGLASHGPIAWTYYTPERFEEARAAGNVVVMDFTAEWCLNCKALEAGVLHQDSVVALLEGDNVIPMKVDLTGDNPEGKAKLKELQWVGIPLLAIFGPGADVGYEAGGAMKYDTYTVQTVMEAVAKAGGQP